MFLVGLTGGIGSGKSAAAEVFLSLGITVVNADEVARIVVEPETLALKEIRQHFGTVVIQKDGNLNRQKLRELVFNDSAELKWLEALLHPLINKYIQNHLRTASSPYAILESPILIESKQYKMVDRVLVIDATEEQQLKRAMQRDTNSQSQIQAIMAKQLNRKDRLENADDIILNDSNLEHLRKKIVSLHKLYLNLAGKHIS